MPARHIRTPPAVTYPTGRSLKLKRLLAALWAAGLLASGAVIFRLFPQSWSLTSSVLLALALWCVAAALRHFWQQQVACELTWDGQQWHLRTLPAPAALPVEPPEVRLDLQSAALLHCRQGGRTRWLWADRSADPTRWHLLRCALYFNATASPLAVPRA